MEELIIRIAGALIVAVAFFFNEYVSDPIHRGIYAILAGSLFFFIDPILSYIRRNKKSKEKSKIVRENLSFLKKFLDKYTYKKLDISILSRELEENNIEQYKDKVAKYVILDLFSEKDEIKKDGIFLSFLCYLIDNEKDEIDISIYKKRISEIIMKYDFLNMTDDSKAILNIYHNYAENNKLLNDTDGIEYKKLFDQFSKKYSQTMQLAFKMYLEKEQIEEFRRTLAILISRGRLSLKLLGKDFSKRIESEINEKTKTTKAYLLLSNKFYAIPEIEATLNKLPNIKFGKKWGNQLPKGVNYLHMRLIYPPKNYQKPQDFLEKEIIPKIPAIQKDKGFISIIPIEGTEIYSYPDKIDKINEEKIRESYSSITSIKTGLPINLAELFLDQIQSEVGIESILSIIPFNIFVPNMSERVKSFIIDNYEKLKQKFNIQVLSDWADINEDDLANELISYDQSRGTRRIYSDANWEALSKKVIQEAKKHRDAMQS